MGRGQSRKAGGVVVLGPRKNVLRWILWGREVDLRTRGNCRGTINRALCTDAARDDDVTVEEQSRSMNGVRRGHIPSLRKGTGMGIVKLSGLGYRAVAELSTMNASGDQHLAVRKERRRG